MLRLPHRNDAKKAKICTLWTFWSVIQPMNNLFKPKGPKVVDFCYFSIISIQGNPSARSKILHLNRNWNH